MKKIAIVFFILNVSLILLGCNDCTKVVPVGCWHSEMGRPDITIEKENNENDDKYKAVIYHKTYDGRICPIEYPLSVTATGMYVQAEGRILISYSVKDKNLLFLSRWLISQMRRHRHRQIALFPNT